MELTCINTDWIIGETGGWGQVWRDRSSKRARWVESGEKVSLPLPGTERQNRYIGLGQGFDSYRDFSRTLQNIFSLH